MRQLEGERCEGKRNNDKIRKRDQRTQKEREERQEDNRNAKCTQNRERRKIIINNNKFENCRIVSHVL
mgnify:CR=1 FL=1